MSSILDTLHSLLTSPVRAVRDLESMVDHALIALWTTLTGVFRDVRSAWLTMLRGAEDAADLLERIPRDLYSFAHWLVKIELPRVLRAAEHYAVSAVRAAGHEAAAVYRELRALIADLAKRIDALAVWVVRKVYEPLDARLQALEHWVAGTAESAIALLTDPERMAALLLTPLWHAFTALLASQSQTIAQWLTAGVYRAMITTADVAETILDALV